MCLKFQLLHNGLRLPEGGDFGALHVQSTNLDRSKKLDLITEPPLWVGAVVRSAFFSVKRV
jgi:hypothetical protein